MYDLDISILSCRMQSPPCKVGAAKQPMLKNGQELGWIRREIDNGTGYQPLTLLG